MSEKPILLNTEMVRAILSGKKTQTRRICKGQPQDGITSPEKIGYKPQYQAGDLLYVRETWKQATVGTAGPGLIDLYLYKADEPQDTTGMMVEGRWHPSIHMPKEAARIFLRVTNVRLERLKDISERDAISEGFDEEPIKDRNTNINFMCSVDCLQGSARGKFAMLWNTTVKPDTKDIYGWDANPWVWVIGFERTEK